MEKEQLNNLLGEMLKVRLLAPELKKMTYNDLIRRRKVYETTQNQDKERYDELQAEGFTENDSEMKNLVEHIKKLDDLQEELNIIENVIKEMPLHELNRKIEVYNTRKNILMERKEELESEGYTTGDRELDEVNNELFSVNELLDTSNKLKQVLPDNMIIEVPTPTKPEPTPTKPEPTPTQPEPAPTQPQPAPTQPQPAPTQPEPAPTQPEPAPTQPEPAPTQPEPAPTQPEPAPTQPEPAPTQPAPKPTKPEPKAKIKGIKIGKQLEIEYENSDKKSVKIDFKRMKQLMKQTPEEKEKMVREILKNSNIRNISKETLKLIDPNVLYAFQNAKKHKMEEKDVEEQVLGYIYALKGDKNYQDKLRGLITYDRTGMDYWKPSTFFSKIFNGKWYKKLDSYSNKAKDFTDVIFDLPGKLRMALAKKDTKLLKQGKESAKDRNKRISENATKNLSGEKQKTETKQNKKEDWKIDKETAEKLRKVEQEFKDQGVRNSVKSDVYRKMEEKASKEGLSK